MTLHRRQSDAIEMRQLCRMTHKICKLANKIPLITVARSWQFNYRLVSVKTISRGCAWSWKHVNVILHPTFVFSYSIGGWINHATDKTVDQVITFYSRVRVKPKGKWTVIGLTRIISCDMHMQITTSSPLSRGFPYYTVWFVGHL